jgi:hypothetical protein
MISEKDIRRCVDLVGQSSLIGWDASQKHNGCFAWWDGDGCGEFFTREGNLIKAPAWFKKDLPAMTLTGEIHAGLGVGYGNHNSAYKVAMTAVRHGGKWFDKKDGKHAIEFIAFDAPKVKGNWRARISAVEMRTSAVEHVRISNSKDLAVYMIQLHAMKSEGAVFNNPDEIDYIPGKTGSQLRWKF